MVPDVKQHREVGFEIGSAAQKFASLNGAETEILFAFGLKGGASLRDLMAMVDVLDGLLKADGDEDAEDDDEKMSEEIAEGESAVVCRMDVNHWLETPRCVDPDDVRTGRR